MNVGRWVASVTFAGTMLLGLGVLIVVLLVQHLRLQQPMSDQQNSMVMLKGAWKIPLETIHCVSRSSKRKTMILDKDYSGDPRVATLFGDAFGVGPARVDDASCMFVDFNAIGHSDQAVRLYGRAAVVLGSVGVCEWRAPPDPDGNSCSDKNIYFFRESEPLELLKLSLAAFVEPQDRGWTVFNADSHHESCTDANRKSIFFESGKLPSDEPPINESPVIIKVSISGLIRPEDWSRAKVASNQPEHSYFAVAQVNEVLKGGLAWHATSVLVNARVGKCVQPLRIGDTGILVGSANDVSDHVVRFSPLLNRGAL